MTSRETTARDISRRESTGSALLWFGVLGAPAAWTVQLLLNYSLEEWFACSPATQTRGVILGLEVDVVATIITVALAGVAVLAGAVSIRCLRSNDLRGRSEGRVRWMAIAGIMNSVLYLITIVVALFVPAILGTCEY